MSQAIPHNIAYTGTSTIVPNPHLKIEECGLPKMMAFRLFEPFIIHHLIEKKAANTMLSAKKLIKEEEDIVEDILREILKNHPILLSHSATLNRFSIQAFKAQLIDGKAIEVSPFIFAAYSMGQEEKSEMSVHIPLRQAAIDEAKSLMQAIRILSKVR